MELSAANLCFAHDSESKDFLVPRQDRGHMGDVKSWYRPFERGRVLGWRRHDGCERETFECEHKATCSIRLPISLTRLSISPKTGNLK